LLSVAVHAANIQDRDGVALVRFVECCAPQMAEGSVYAPAASLGVTLAVIQAVSR
jgi:hypothetical protein